MKLKFEVLEHCILDKGYKYNVIREPNGIDFYDHAQFARSRAL